MIYSNYDIHLRATVRFTLNGNKLEKYVQVSMQI